MEAIFGYFCKKEVVRPMAEMAVEDCVNTERPGSKVAMTYSLRYPGWPSALIVVDMAPVPYPGMGEIQACPKPALSPR